MKKKHEEERPDEDIARGIDRGIEKLESRRDSKEDQRYAGELKGQRARGALEKLLTRALSGVIYVVIIVGCFFGGVIPTALLVAAMGWVCCSEFFRITRMAGRSPNEIFGLAAALMYPLLSVYWGVKWLVAVTVLLLMVTASWYVMNPRANISDVAVTLLGPLYTSCMLTSLSLIRASNPGIEGAFLTLIVMGSIWAEDSLAYLVGSSIGRHKMAPRTSPNKSWEGFVGGLVGAIAVWCVGAFFHVGGLTWSVALICGAFEGVIAVIGDLFESRIKRGVGVKDSGNLLPGHGGLLDRTDSVLFGGMVAFFILHLGGVL